VGGGAGGGGKGLDLLNKSLSHTKMKFLDKTSTTKKFISYFARHFLFLKKYLA
jgi:hypothetical protein